MMKNLGFYEILKILGFMLESDLGILFNWVEIDEIGFDVIDHSN